MILLGDLLADLVILEIDNDFDLDVDREYILVWRKDLSNVVLSLADEGSRFRIFIPNGSEIVDGLVRFLKPRNSYD